MKTAGKLLALVLALVMLFSLAACATETDTPGGDPAETPANAATPAPGEGEETAAMTPGTYTASAAGRNGQLTVEVTVDESSVTAIEVTEHAETAIISDPAFERVIDNVLTYQSLQMDGVTGATITRAALLSAIGDAIDQAGGDSGEWRERPGQHTDAGEDEVYDVDVVVVGGGGAGLAAAAAAIDGGASVMLIEKTAALGGNTLLSGGVMNAADPAWQAQAEAATGEDAELEALMNLDPETFPEEYRPTFEVLQGQIAEYLAGDRSYLFDSVELHTIHTYYYGARTGLDGTGIYGDFDLVSHMTANALDTVNWLSEKGIEWQATVSEPVGAMWRRGHTPTMPKGQEYAVKIGAFIEDSGNTILLETAGKALLTDASGAVVGIEAERADGTKVTINAAKGVILATGGYGSNTAMVQEYNNYWEDIPDTIKTTNASGSTGDGITMGLEAGAALTGMGFVQMMPVSDRVTGDLFTGLIPRLASNYIFVNAEGRRFVDEGAERDTLALAALEQTDGMFYMIADADIAEEAKWLTDPEVEVANGRAYKADTLEELAGLIGIDPDVLVEEMEKYNSYVDAGADPDFGKASFDQKVDTPPYYATPRAPAIHHTMGGLVINTNAEVLNEAGEVIVGLYAAGEVTGGIHAGNRLGGNAIADIMVFGRTAGMSAAAR